MFKFAKHSKFSSNGRMVDLIPWAVFVAPGIILNKDGSLQQTLCFRGPDFASSSSEHLIHVCAKLNNICKRFGSGWILYIEAARSKEEAYLKESQFPDPVSQLIDEERRMFFESSQQTYNSVYYFTLQYLPPEESSRRAQKIFMQDSSEQNQTAYDEVLSQFQNQVNLLKNLLAEFMYDVKILSNDETVTYLHQCISDKNHFVSAPDEPVYLDALLCDTPLHNGFILQLGNSHLKTLSITGFPSASMPALLEQLNALPIEYRWVTRYIPMDKLDAEQVLKGYRRRWFSKRKSALSMLMEVFSKSESALQDNAAIRYAQDTDEAMQELSADYINYGYFTATITLISTDLKQLESAIQQVERVINGLGFITFRESINALEAWLSSLPGQAYANIRTPLLHSLNVCHLLPLSSPWSGNGWNKHLQAPALMMAHTRGSSPFYFSNHVNDVGHQLIIGPTGSGKSVLLNMIALQFLRYEGSQVFIFDKGLSFLISTLSTNGQLYYLGDDENSLKFQPLANIDKKEEQLWALDWIMGLCDVQPDAAERELLWDALELLKELPAQYRSLTSYHTLLQDEDLKQSLLPYILDGPFGVLFDGQYDQIMNNRWIYFEMEKLMAMPDALAPVLFYLFHLLEQRFTGQPTLLLLDEAWLFLDHPLFAKKIREWLKTLRKKNVSVIFATQSVTDLMESSITSSLLESCPSRVYLPNNRALEPSLFKVYEQLGLSDQQINLIASAHPRQDYYYQSFVGNALFNLQLGPIALAFADAGNAEKKQTLKRLYEQYGYPYFIPFYLKSQGLYDVAAIFDTEPDQLIEENTEQESLNK
ncbi:MAG: conjugal transfer protein TrbE [Endozoicomonadaceae bacterium]|nr:conjugal transfer protein TrbE [Endozoicomonadaceae bacterium]